MGLLQKKPITTSVDLPIYTIGSQSTLLIIGLGNIGEKYQGTRHNIGFAAVDHFVSAHSELSHWIEKKDLKCHFTMGSFGNIRVIVIKPTTFMNDSGQALTAVQSFFKISPEQTIAVYDELDILFGQIRSRVGGDPAGHNGVKSLIEHSAPGFGRVRIGIQNEHSGSSDSANFVLKSFNAEEKKHLPALLQETDSILIEAIFKGELEPETRNFII